MIGGNIIVENDFCLLGDTHFNNLLHHEESFLMICIREITTSPGRKPFSDGIQRGGKHLVATPLPLMSLACCPSTSTMIIWGCRVNLSLSLQDLPKPYLLGECCLCLGWEDSLLFGVWSYVWGIKGVSDNGFALICNIL